MEPQVSCSLHEYPCSLLSMPRMWKLTPVRWLTIFDVSLQIFGPVAHAAHLLKALISMDQLKWLPVNFEPAWLSKNKYVCKKCMRGFKICKALQSIINGSFNYTTCFHFWKLWPFFIVSDLSLLWSFFIILIHPVNLTLCFNWHSSTLTNCLTFYLLASTATSYSTYQLQL